MVHGLDARDILWVWERGQGGSSSERALLVLMAAVAGADWRELAELPLGRRQARLLSVREKTYGPRLEVFVECPGCDAELEFELDTSEERHLEDDCALESTLASDSSIALEVGEFALELRLPNTADILALERADGLEDPRRELFSRCLLEAHLVGESAGESAVESAGADKLDAQSVPDEVVARAAQAMAERDPQAESLHTLDCPMCGHQWEAVFEIADYLWREIEVDARRLLREVDLIAKSYGWSEDQILALSPFRRRCYMELIAP
ncbi:MAG: hypothetical protein ACOC9W_01655 [Persicimonas sp.]